MDVRRPIPFTPGRESKNAIAIMQVMLKTRIRVIGVIACAGSEGKKMYFAATEQSSALFPFYNERKDSLRDRKRGASIGNSPRH